MERLTAYQLSCGSIEKHLVKQDHLFTTWVELYKELGVYHVRAFKGVNGSSSTEKLSWESFYSLAEARMRLNKIKKILIKEEKQPC